MEINEQEILQHVGARIRFFRESKGWTLRDLEAYSNIDHALISKVERGLRKAEFMTIYRLAVVLEVDLNTLLSK